MSNYLDKRKKCTSCLIAVFLFVSCSKVDQPLNASFPPPASPSTPPSSSSEKVFCEGRPVVNARLVPIGSLSEARIGLASASVGNKILFAGGMKTGAYSSRVDVYDVTKNTWSTAELSVTARQGMAVATVGSKVLFAGGGDNDDGIVTSRVDIYDAYTNTWSTAELSKGREYLTATTLGNKVFFAGGGDWEPNLIGSKVVDIYDNATNSWTTAFMREGRMDHSATAVDNKIYFAGGYKGYYTSLGILQSIDIYDAATNTWSTSSLMEPRAHMASIAVGNKIYWAGGVNIHSFTNRSQSNTVEIRDVTTGNSFSACVVPRSMFQAVVKDDNIVFFTGRFTNNADSNRFEIYNTTTNTWSTGVLDRVISDATIISVNNTIYVAGGRDNAWGPYFGQVWKLEF